MSNIKTLFIPLGSGGPSPANYYTKQEIDAMLESYGAGFTMTIDGTTFVITASLKNADGDVLGTSQTIDLPLESVVVNGSYDSTNKKIILTLQNGNTIDVPVGDLVSGLQTEITSQNKLSADLVDDTSTTNKFVTAADLSDIAANTTARHTHSNKAILDATTASFTDSSYVHTDNNYTDGDKTKLSGIEAGAQVNVKPDWDAAAGTAAEILHKPTIPTVNDATITIQQNGTTVGTFTTNDDTDTTINLTGGGGGSDWYGTQAQFNAIAQKDADTNYHISDKLDYKTDLKNTPNLSVYARKTEVNAADTALDKKIIAKMEAQFMTEQEFSQITPKEGENYFIEGQTVQMVVTFTDSTTATYNVVVD